MSYNKQRYLERSLSLEYRIENECLGTYKTHIILQSAAYDASLRHQIHQRSECVLSLPW